MASIPEFLINVIAVDGAKVTLTKGDTLVIMARDHITDAQRDALKQAVISGLPEGVKAIVLDAGMTVAAIRQGNPDYPLREIDANSEFMKPPEINERKYK